MSRNIFVVLDELSAGIQELKQALAPLSVLASSSAGAVGVRPARRQRGRKVRPVKPAAAGPTKTPSTKIKGGAKKRTPGQVLHIQYMNALKSLGAGDQARVKKLRAAEGPEAALKLATSLTK